MQNLNNKNQNHTSHIAPHTSQKGITLIALIITIIVMLILVGVTVNVALNGGLFQRAEQATYQTKASTVKEQLEIAKAISIANNDGKLLDDYSGITVGNLEGLDAKTIEEYKDKIVVAKNGDICYNSENVIDTEERAWLEEIGIREYIDMVEPETFKFTLGEIAPNATFNGGYIIMSTTSFWSDTVSDELKNSGTEINGMLVYENATSSDSMIPNVASQFVATNGEFASESGFMLAIIGEEVWIEIKKDNNIISNSNNWSTYENLEFTITL